MQTGPLVSKMPFCFLNFRDSNPENVYFSNFHLPSYKPDQKGKFIKRKTRTIYRVPKLRISPIKTLELSHSVCLWLQNKCSIFFQMKNTFSSVLWFSFIYENDHFYNSWNKFSGSLIYLTSNKYFYSL